ncbi:hypothetical protein HDU98_004738, partial [Podochytrium sp. JEL0797]
MIPAILSNLSEETRLRASSATPPPDGAGGSISKPTATPPLIAPTPPMRTTTIADDLFHPPLLQQSAQASLEALFAQANGQTLKSLVDPTWVYLSEHHAWADRAMVVEVVSVVAAAVGPQYQYILVQSLVERLKRREGGVEERCGFAVGVTVLIARGGGSGGVAAVELLETFVGLVAETAAGVYSGAGGEGGRVFHEALVEGVGALGIHVLYPTQLNDLVGFVVNRMGKVVVGGEEAVAVKKSLVRCLVKLVAVRRACLTPMESLTNLATGVALEEVPQGGGRRGEEEWQLDRFSTVTRSAVSPHGAQQQQQKRTSLTSFSAAKISPLLLTPLLPYLQDPSQDLRILISLFLNSTLALEIAQQHATTFNTIPPATEPDLDFLHHLYQSLHAYAQSPTLGPVDALAIGTLLVHLVSRFGTGANGLGRTLQLLVTLQNATTTTSPSSHRVVHALVMHHLMYIAKMYDVDELEAYVNTVQNAGVGEESGVPCTTDVDGLWRSVRYWVVQGGVGAADGVAARTFAGVAGGVVVAASPSVFVPLVCASKKVEGEEVRRKVGEVFVVDKGEGAAGGGVVIPAVVVGEVVVVGGSANGTPVVKPSFTPRVPSDGKSFRVEAVSVRSGTSFKMDLQPVKFEDLKDAISVHSSGESIRTANGSFRAITPVLPVNKKGKVDVKKLLNSISSSIKDVGQKSHFLEPSRLGKQHIRFSLDRSQSTDLQLKQQQESVSHGGGGAPTPANAVVDVTAEQPSAAPIMTVEKEGG